MRRSFEVPLLLWLPAAILLHLGAADGGDVVGKVHVDRSALERLGAVVRERVRASEQTLVIEGIDAPTLEESKPADDPIRVLDEKKKKEQAEAEKKKEEEKKVAKEEKRLIKILEEKDSKPQPPPPPLQDKRIAVKQRSKADQEDNPNANFIADQANKVKEETAATQTSLDQDDPDPTPGGNRAGSDPKMGDSDRTKIAQNDESPGEKDKAPGEKGTEFRVEKTELPMAALAPTTATQKTAPSGGDRRASTAPASDVPQPAPAPVAPSDAVAEANRGGWSFNPIRPGASGGLSPQPAHGQATAQNDRAPTGPMPILGLGGTPGPGQVNLNLNHHGVVATVGHDQLHKERVADGERRKSEHRGSWVASSFERWRSAIENYVSSVKAGNQTALNAARSPFATYLHSIHNRIHPIFADSFLGSLDALPKTHPLNDGKLITRLEIVLSREGQLVKMGIVKTSGMTAFDIAALDAVQRASPFGSAPSAILSPDGRVYLHWEFHRDEVFACSTMNARPFILNVPAGAPPPEQAPPRGPVPPTKERELPPASPFDTRQGVLPRPAREALKRG